MNEVHLLSAGALSPRENSWALARAQPGLGTCPVQVLGLMAAPFSLRQTHGSQLRLHNISPADSGEYVCRIVGGAGPEQEASFTVTVPPKAAGSSYRECGRCRGRGKGGDWS